MSHPGDIRIDDLSEPILSAAQQAARDGAEQFPVELSEEELQALDWEPLSCRRRPPGLSADEWRAFFSADEHGVYFSRGRVAERQMRGRRQKCRRKKGEGQKAGCTRARKGGYTRGGRCGACTPRGP